MTSSEVTKRMRNSVLFCTGALTLLSWIAAHAMQWWFVPLDYWLLWAAVFTGVGAVGCAVSSIILHCSYLDELKTI